MTKEITLREHMSRIAKQRHETLKKKLGKKGYAEMMSNVSKGQKLDKTSTSVLE